MKRIFILSLIIGFSFFLTFAEAESFEMGDLREGVNYFATVNSDGTVNLFTVIRDDNLNGYGGYGYTWYIFEGETLVDITTNVGMVDYDLVGYDLSISLTNLEGRPFYIVIETIRQGFVIDEIGPLKVGKFRYLYMPDMPYPVITITLPDSHSFISSSRTPLSISDNKRELTYQEIFPIQINYLSDKDTEGGYTQREVGPYILIAPSASMAGFEEGAQTATGQYSLIEDTLGYTSPFSQYPLLIVNEASGKISSGQSGTHSNGLIYLAEDALEKNFFKIRIPTTIIHETTHGFNSKVLGWNDAGDFWFEEGTAEFFEYLAARKLGIENYMSFDKTDEGFGSDFFDLAAYYNSDGDYLGLWDPNDEAFSAVTKFGYSMSQMVIRDFVTAYGIDALQKTYHDLLENPPESTTDRVERNEAVVSAMRNATGVEMTADDVLNPGKEILMTEGIDAFRDWMHDLSNNLPPEADAGENITSETSEVRLNGSGSFDLDGNISSFSWIDDNNGEILASGADAVMTVNLTKGTYHITLKLTDDFGAEASDTVRVMVTDEGTDIPDGDGPPDGDGSTVLKSGDVNSDGIISTPELLELLGRWRPTTEGSTANLLNALDMWNPMIDYNPGVVDTDGDGITDHQEYWVADTDPLTA